MTADNDDVEIPVWVGGLEKWVTGLTKRTTCEDVIYALLCHEGNPQGFVDVPSFAICEQWKGVERQLNGRTKIVKLWRTWGSDVRKVRFYMRKVEASSDVNRSRRSRQRYGGYQDSQDQDSQDQHHRYHVSTRNQGRDYVQSERIPQQQGVVRRRSRSVEPRSGKREHTKVHSAHHEMEHVNPETFECDSEAKALQQLMSVLMEQERKLSEQQGRIKEIDVQIENYESKTHSLRIQKNGHNYVQEAYLRDKSDESSSSGGEESYVSAKAREMESYLNLCESLVKMESKLCVEHSKIDDLSLLLCEQSVLEMSLPTRRSAHAQQQFDISSNSAHDVSSADRSVVDELESLKSDLQRSLSTGMAQQYELETVTQTLNEWDLQLQEKTVLLNSLLLEVDELEMKERVEKAETSKDFVVSKRDLHSSQQHNGAPNEQNEQFASPGNHVKSRDITLSENHSNDQTLSNGYFTSTPVVNSGQTHLPKHPPNKCNIDSSAILADLHSSARSRMESQTSDWDWENELPMMAQKNLLAKTMIPYRTYTTYEESAGLGLGLANSLKHTALDDSNSDTGLSSLHSDEAPPILETLV